MVEIRLIPPRCYCTTLSLCLLGPFVLAGQSPRATTNLVRDAGAGGVAANNPWLGAQLAYKFAGSDEIADNFMVAARLLYDPFATDKLANGDEVGFHIPVMGNLASLIANESSGGSLEEHLKDKTQQLLNSAQGINVGLYPFWVVKRGTLVRVTVHGSAGWKLNALKDTAGETVYLNQARLSGGVEVALGRIREGRLPITFSATPTLTILGAGTYQRVFRERRASIVGFELTSVLPVGKGFGVLLEGILTGRSRSGLRAGLLFATEVS